MKASNRIIVNTLAQYVRTILNMLLSIYSARLVLNILGVADYGIFILVAGVVEMLSFLTNSLVGSTQRFLSVYQGRGDKAKLNDVFCNSLLLHVFLGLAVLALLECLTPFLFDGFLNIPANKADAAAAIYQMVVVMVYISFIAAPYRALLVSRENIVYTSVIDVCSGVLKVILVTLLAYVQADKLVAYGWIMVGIMTFNLLSFAVYCHARYEECSVPRLRVFNMDYLKELIGFTGWVTYSTSCIAFRNQGLSIILNKWLDTTVNAAYGFGMQISGMVSFVSTSLSNAIAPQTMAARGAGDMRRMWLLAEVQSKFAYLLLAMVGIPTIFSMQALLSLWLGTVPPYTALFGSMFMIMQIVDMLTTGLGIAKNALGNIKVYSLVIYTPKILLLPLCWYSLYLGLPLWTIAVIFVVVEFLCMVMRLVMLRGADGFAPLAYCRNVMLRIVPPTIAGIACCIVAMGIPPFPGSFLMTYVFSMPVFVLTAYGCSLSELEKQKIKSITCTVMDKLGRHATV